MSFEELNFGEQRWAWPFLPMAPSLLYRGRQPSTSPRPSAPLGYSPFAAVGSCEQPAVTDEVRPAEEMGEVEQPSLPGLRVGATFLGPDRLRCLPSPALGVLGMGGRVVGEPGGRARGETLDRGLMEGSGNWATEGA